MPFLFGKAYRRFGKNYFLLYVVFEFVSAFIVCLATVGLFALYTDPSSSEFWTIARFAEVCVVLSTGFMLWGGAKRVRPIIDWMEGHGDALEAWRAAVEVPRELTLRVGWQPFLLIGVPVAIFATIEADLPAYSAFIIFAGTAVAVAYAAVLHFFSYEQFLRPVVEDIAGELPPDFSGAPLGVPLRWKLLGALPLINVITGVVVSGLSTDGTAQLEDLGLDVVVAVLVAFTISLELTLLVTRSVLQPVDSLLEATEAVKRGDLDARVPITSGDEMGQLAGSFNEMMQGLSEREALREAFGAYVDPDVAQRVLEQGDELIEGQEREVTVMILDVRDFTRVRAALERARDGDLPQRAVRHRGPVRGGARWPREQVPRRRPARGVRRSRPAAGPRRPRGCGGRRHRTAAHGALRRRGSVRHRHQLGARRGGVRGRRRPPRIRGDRRSRERRRARGAPHQGDRRHRPFDRGHSVPAHQWLAKTRT